MNVTKIILGTLIGAVFTGVVFSLVSYIITINDHSGGGSWIFGSAKEWWWLAIIAGFIIGVVIGGFSGAVITAFNFKLLIAVIFGGLFNLFLISAFYIFVESGWSDGIAYKFYSLIPIGAVNGAVVSLFNYWQQLSLK